MKKLLVPLAPGFEEIEALGVIDVMRRIGIQVTTAALDSPLVPGAHKVGIMADTLLNQVYVSGFDAIFLPGGMQPGAARLLESEPTLAAVKQLHAAGKTVSAICAAPIVLAKAGVLKGIRFTMYPGMDEYISPLTPTGNLAERDGNVVTGKGPGASFAFAAKLAEALGCAEECKKVFAAMFVEL